MTERERRQRRLLHVRDLQADLAAARLRQTRAEEQEDRREIEELAPLLHVAPSADGPDWVLRCAEGELYSLRTQQVLTRIEERQPRLQAERDEEQVRRQQREQVKRLCDRTATLSQHEQGRAEQARLDDLFSSAQVRLRQAYHNEL